MNKIISYLLLLALCISSSLALATKDDEKRYALVIGNSLYKTAPLKNPVNDAADMSAKLSKYGFDVEQLFNADKKKMREAINRFGQKLLKKDAIGLFFFAGHGVQSQNSNYLLPINANIIDEADVEFEAINANRVLNKMAFANNGLNIMVLDACRNTTIPRSTRSAANGLTFMRPASGSLIFYATEPGKVATDGKGRNGLFTEKLMGNMDIEGLKVEDVFKKTAIDVRDASRNRQTPWSEGVILGEFYFSDPPKEVAKVALEDGLLENQQENIFWKSVEKMPSINAYEAYLKKYPDGNYVDLAQLKIQQLQADVIEVSDEGRKVTDVKPTQNVAKTTKKPFEKKKLTKKSLSAEKDVKKKAQLTVRSNVYDDLVILNGEAIGSTRLDLDLNPGTYKVEITKSGYEDDIKEIKLKAGQKKTIYAKLLPQDPQARAAFLAKISKKRNNKKVAKSDDADDFIPGKLTIRSNVYDDRVLLNGKILGSTKIDLNKVRPGEYRLEVSKNGYVTYRQDFVLEPGAHRLIYVQLEKQPQGSFFENLGKLFSGDEKAKK